MMQQLPELMDEQDFQWLQTQGTLELRAAALVVLACTDLDQKRDLCLALQAKIQADEVILDAGRSFMDDLVFTTQCPGRPAKPELMSALDVPRRRAHSLEGRQAMIHALAHIEFNAINLALDVMVRFANLPEAFYWDWWRVAFEESYHFSLLREHLQGMGADYGDFSAHNGLWDMAEKTASSLGDRMAMVPRTLEARGLDACPLMRDKLRAAGDARGADIVDIILHDEIGHVALGNRWFIYACELNSQNPVMQYRALAEQYNAPRLRPPFNLVARRAAGFFEEELTALAAI